MKNIFAFLACFLFAHASPAQVIYTGPGDGTTDNKEMMEAAQGAVCGSANRTLIMRCGTYRFLAPPAAPSCAINLVGEGKACTMLVKDYSGQGAYFLKRQQNASDTYGGGSIRDLTILAGPASKDGIAVWIVASTDGSSSAQSKNPHGILLDNLMIGAFPGGGTFGFGIYLDGYANTSNAIGIRSVSVRNTSVAAATVAGIYLYRAIGTHITATECYGTPTHALAVDGASDSTVILSRTCAPSILSGINTYKWP